MPETVTISQLNRIIIFNQYTFSQDSKGGNVKTLIDSYDLFASVELITNSYLLEQLQVKYGKGYKVKVRYEPSRILTPNDEIAYEGKILKIHSIRTETEARKKMVVITCYTG